ncbi:hypothetical protein G6R27_05560 [Fructobacillus sp. M1-10]|uniref:NlpC/P60 domain-containing protein n=2 Tax=Fructobacillus papyriferae TaxID=2713171 RepID=A0ABS5QQM5_9LACO|nr:hypothetical protein [Fructobacillus papyriferae]
MTTDEAAKQMGLSDQGLLVAGQHMSKQAGIIQGLKDAGYLQDEQQTTQADLGNGDQNLIVLQKGTPTLDDGKATQSQTSDGVVNNQSGSQSGADAAYQQGSQAAADSQAASLADSQAQASKAQASQAQSAASTSASQSQEAASTSASQSQAPASSAATSSADQSESQANSSANQAATDEASTDEGLANKMGDDSNQADNGAVDSQGSVTQTSYTPAQPAAQENNSQAANNDTQNQRVDSEAVINWFYNHMGRLTYNMSGSRNGADGTADCSGSMVEAMYEAGASKPAYLYNTDSMHSYLQENGYHLVSTNTPWEAERGDIVIWGQRGASGGSAGHVQIMTDANNAISVNYAHGDQAGAAVSTWNYNNAYFYNQKANGGSLAYYVYRQ